MPQNAASLCQEVTQFGLTPEQLFFVGLGIKWRQRSVDQPGLAERACRTVVNACFRRCLRLPADRAILRPRRVWSLDSAGGAILYVAGVPRCLRRERKSPCSSQARVIPTRSIIENSFTSKRSDLPAKKA
ncbi:hypothetical protein MRX96_006460 [Rhipicephalus microplus]